ncbi:MAG: adenylyl-sulfate kinase [Deltaproteobacteria bacterium]|nr:adenylyl-sulfate kinase [Deltaproteobacteria bacterium]MBW1816110.1 adenylyl-sulfate kinase [Deltaproteobacteria bacterium]MBW2284290.1 adenylyl-sulfate kinase [Deltaproteobacteria bacterium]
MQEVREKNNVTWFNGAVSREKRENLHGHKGAVIWFTGLSASGKSTIAHHLERLLYEAGCSTYVFDGDNVRHGLCADLSFTPEHRSENIRRIGEMTKLFVDAGVIAVTAFISPYKEDRDSVRRLVGDASFLEIFVQCPPEVCAARDPKGLYERAQRGEIKEFTGVSAPYEEPADPDLTIHSSDEDADTAARRVYDLIKQRHIIGVSREAVEDHD